MDTADFDRDLAAHNLAGLWAAGVPGHKAEKPFLWTWQSVHDGLLRAKDEIGLDAAERRVVKLLNPNLSLPISSRTVQFNFQLVNPGEVARAHRHSLAAIRFILEGRGGYTNVDGERCDMEPGDFILTPAWTWHDHFNGSNEAVIWLDGLDGPLIQALNLGLFEGYGGESQPIKDASGAQFRVPWRIAYGALQTATHSDESPFDGAVYRYPDMPTLASELTRLRPGARTQTHRHLSAAMYHVFKGAGRSTIGEDTIDWRRGDTFVIPAWSWHSHEARQAEEAVLFSMSDRPAMQALKLYREEQR
jgi:gentisate 1,2-dioxygenase